MEQSVTKRIAKNFSWLLAGNIASGLINFFTIVYIARVLGAATFGLLQFAMAFLLYLVIIVDSGLSTYGSREIAQNRSEAGRISINIFSLRLMLALATFFLSLLVLLTIPISSVLRLLFTVAFLLVFYRALNADWVFQGLERLEYVAISKLLFSGITFLFVVLFVKGPEELLVVPLIQFIFGLIIGVAFLVILFRKYLRFDLKWISFASWPKVFLLAIPLGISVIFLQIYDNLDTIILGLLDKPAIVGIYNAAYRIFYIFAGVFSLWLTTLFPVVCKRMSENKDRTRLFLEKVMRLTLLLAIPVTLLVCLASPLFIQLFFGDKYMLAIPALRYLIWALVPLAISNIYGSLLLIPAGLFNQFLASVGVGALSNITLNIILIPRFSYIGAAVATVIAQVVAGITAFNLSKKVFRVGFLRNLFKPLIISLFSYGAFLLGFSLLSTWLPIMRLLVANGLFVLTAGILLVNLEREFFFGFVKEIFRK